ncbi:3-hydroxyacyl-CoA dehydrogenase [Ehrlichia canis]|uniref:3-hydroxyacyl-CoA dehydrogenase n=1 Tax=Ehrlichia canis (strain Jake) TaxID=269484 RepID=A0ACA6AVY3_EHRCJ|nr:3-hydroxyacyl-CoA dehydrogenase [Ehrlichia canis]AAZ68492.1 putative 3-hydroxyacyl-CoA dehydrogenase [Ehrlichia canis str. Jake]
MQIQKVAIVNFKRIDISSIINYIVKCNISVVVIILNKADNILQYQEDSILVSTVHLNDDLSCLRDVRWVININSEKEEEDVILIRNIYSKILSHISHNVIISASSSVYLDIIREMQCNVSCNLLIASFFNSDNTIRLIECANYYSSQVKCDNTIQILSNSFSNLIVCNNIPGLVLDRVIVFWLMISLIGAYNFNINVEEVDFIISNECMGIPTGVFNLLDKMGLDNFILKVKYLIKHLPDDYLCKLYNFTPTVVLQMISDGYTGSTGKIGGFYRFYELYGGNNNQVIDLYTGLYRQAYVVSRDFEKIQDLFCANNKHCQFMWYVWSNTLIYVASLIPNLSHNISVIDKAIKLAYGWKHGPFEMIDLINDFTNNKFFDLHDNLPQILSIKKNMYNSKKQCLNIDGNYI